MRQQGGVGGNDNGQGDAMMRTVLRQDGENVGEMQKDRLEGIGSEEQRGAEDDQDGDEKGVLFKSFLGHICSYACVIGACHQL